MMHRGFKQRQITARPQVGSYNSGILQFITVLRHKKYGKSRTTYVDSSERQTDWLTSVAKALAPSSLADSSHRKSRRAAM